MSETMDTVYIECDIAVIVGNAGIGKTEGAIHYSLEHPDCILVECDPSFGAKVLLQEILSHLGTEARGTIYQMMKQIEYRMAGSGRMIVIDEAEHLPHRALEIMRRLHDKLEIGICLIGMQRLIENIRGGGLYRQLYSRVGVFCDLRDLEPEDIEAILRQVKISRETKQALLSAAQSNARTLDKLLKRSRRLAKLNNMEITPDIVQRAEELLIV